MGNEGMPSVGSRRLVLFNDKGRHPRAAVDLGTKEGKLHITKASAGHTRVGWRPRERTGKWLPG